MPMAVKLAAQTKKGLCLAQLARMTMMAQLVVAPEIPADYDDIASLTSWRRTTNTAATTTCTVRSILFWGPIRVLPETPHSFDYSPRDLQLVRLAIIFASSGQEELIDDDDDDEVRYSHGPVDLAKWSHN